MMEYRCDTSAPHICSGDHLVPGPFTFFIGSDPSCHLPVPAQSNVDCSLSIWYQNVKGLKARLPALEAFLSKRPRGPDLLFTAESGTKFKSGASLLPDYKVAKVGTGRHGLICHCRSDFSVEILDLPNVISSNEFLLARIRLPSAEAILVLALYVPPAEYVDFSVIDAAKALGHSLTVIGDLNLHLDGYNSGVTDSFGLHFIDGANQRRLIVRNSPADDDWTFVHTSGSTSTIDFVATLDLDLPAYLDLLDYPDFGDHRVLDLTVDSVPSREPLNHRPSFDWKRCDDLAFATRLDELLPDPDSVFARTQACVDKLLSLIQDALIQTTLDVVKPVSPPPPHAWHLTQEIHQEILAIRRLREQQSKHRRWYGITDLFIAKEISDAISRRNLLIREQRESRFAEITKKLDHEKVPQNFYRLVNKLTGIKSGPLAAKHLVTVSTDSATGQQVSNEHLTPAQRAAVFMEDLQRHMTPEEPHEDDLAYHNEAISSYSLPSLYPLVHTDQCDATAEPLTDSLRLKAVIRSRPNKAPGEDGVRIQMLKRGSSKLFHLLAVVLNTCFALGYFPRSFKAAKVVMILKPQKPAADPGSYRPISLLGAIGKIYENLVNRRIARFINAHNIWAPFQAAYRCGYSTTDHLLHINEVAHEVMAKRRLMLCASLDCSRAFDKVWHPGVGHLMREYGFPLHHIRLVKSYLSDRSVRVECANALSVRFSPKAGTPQGGVLSTTIFNLYVNRVSQQTKFCTILQYADDIFAYIISGFRQRSLVSKRLSSDLQRIADHLRRLKIPLNAGKSRLLPIYRAPAFPPANIKVTMNRSELTMVKDHKFLGVPIHYRPFVNRPLINQIRGVCDRLHSKLKAICDPRYSSLSTKTILRLSTVYLRSVVAYGGVSLYNAQACDIDRINVIQNRVLRLAYGTSTLCSNERLHQLANIPTLHDQLKALAVKYVKRLQAKGRIPAAMLAQIDARNLKNQHPDVFINYHFRRIVSPLQCIIAEIQGNPAPVMTRLSHVDRNG